MQKSQAEECGPNGFCFSFNGTDLAKYIKIVRGCDDSFVCEVMVHNITDGGNYSVGVKKQSAFGFLIYCANNVMIRPTQEVQEMIGMLCCCNQDWCNANYKDEPINDVDVIFELDHGTEEDYFQLKNIADKYGIK